MLFCSGIHTNNIDVPKWPATYGVAVLTKSRDLECINFFQKFSLKGLQFP